MVLPSSERKLPMTTSEMKLETERNGGLSDLDNEEKQKRQEPRRSTSQDLTICDLSGSGSVSIDEKALEGGKGDQSKVVESADGTVTAEPAPSPAADDGEPVFHVYGHRTKVFVMLAASFMALVSPLAAAVYFPAIGDIARDLHTTPSLINLSITTYQILQGIAPSFVGAFSDTYGRRPAYIYCYTIFLASCIGLALQNNYAALMVLRCLQSAGSSGTIALGSAVVADLSTRAERGRYNAYATLGTTLGPAFGPLIGGVLNEYYGWRSIFWFLSALAGTLLLFTIFVMPETCRAVVGNGSIPPPKWNRSVLAIYRQKMDQKKGNVRPTAKPEGKRKRPNPFMSVRIAMEKQAGVLLTFTGLTNAGYQLVLSTLTTELATRYGLNSLHIGLSYLPVGIGSMSSRWTAGSLLDRNFRRWAKNEGLEIVYNKQQDISHFPVERARLQVQIPLVYLGAVTLIMYGWLMDFHTSLAGPLVVLFFLGHALSGCNTCLSTLLVDTHRESPATATAASNLFRCLFSAGATAFALPLINAIGIGWTGTLVALVWIVLSPLLWSVYIWGTGWRQAHDANVAAKRAAKAARKEQEARAAVERAFEGAGEKVDREKEQC